MLLAKLGNGGFPATVEAGLLLMTVSDTDEVMEGISAVEAAGVMAEAATEAMFEAAS